MMAYSFMFFFNFLNVDVYPGEKKYRRKLWHKLWKFEKSSYNGCHWDTSGSFLPVENIDHNPTCLELREPQGTSLVLVFSALTAVTRVGRFLGNVTVHSLLMEFQTLIPQWTSLYHAAVVTDAPLIWPEKQVFSKRHTDESALECHHRLHFKNYYTAKYGDIHVNPQCVDSFGEALKVYGTLIIRTKSRTPDSTEGTW